MHLKAIILAGCTALLSLAVLDLPADAAPKKKRVVTRTTHVRVASRPRVRVRVAPRSYTDAGTEVRPGERKFLEYAFPLSYSPTGAIDNTAFSRPTSLPGPNNWSGPLIRGW